MNQSLEENESREYQNWNLFPKYSKQVIKVEYKKGTRSNNNNNREWLLLLSIHVHRAWFTIEMQMKWTIKVIDDRFNIHKSGRDTHAIKRWLILDVTIV